jgi:hypothetical protein
MSRISNQDASRGAQSAPVAASQESQEVFEDGCFVTDVEKARAFRSMPTVEKGSQVMGAFSQLLVVVIFRFFDQSASEL